MTRRKRLPGFKTVIAHADQPKHASRDEAWSGVGPVLARRLGLAVILMSQFDKPLL
jgi:hypothetical protein